MFPRANGWFHEVLLPKTWSPRSRGLEIFKQVALERNALWNPNQVALERNALWNPNQVAPRISGWCWGATPDPMLSATRTHTLPLLQNFNFRISCVWSRFWWVVSVLCGSIYFIGEISTNFDLENTILMWCCVFAWRICHKFIGFWRNFFPKHLNYMK